MPKTYEPIATQTVSGTSTSTVTFSTISNAYTDLFLMINAGATATGCALIYRLNGDTASNYSTTALRGNGTAASSFRQSNTDSVVVSNFSEPPTTGGGVYTINFQNYTNTTTSKTSISRGNSAGFGVDTFVGLWRKTPEAITSISIVILSGNYNSGSTFTLYGIKAA